MRWPRFRGRLPEPAAPRGEIADDDSRHPSLALNALCHRLRDGRKYNVLDLGPACGDNVEFFSRFAGKIYIEDLHRTLNSFDYLSPEDGLPYDSVFRYLLPYQKSTRFDLIFAWDLFNYLDRREFLFLMRHLSRFCREDAMIFALISTNKSIPDRPPRYRIVDHETLTCRPETGILRPCPRYQESDLAHMMPSFRACQSFLMRNGVKEYLFLHELRRGASRQV